jgi:hypothetical protein
MKILLLVLGLASAAVGQTASKKTPEQLQALFDQHKGDFDYLLSDWNSRPTTSNMASRTDAGAPCAWRPVRSSTSIV